MTTIKIYGASDDLIEVESSDFPDEEFNVSEPMLLSVSDGTLIRFRYDEEGIWRFTPIMLGSSYVALDRAEYSGDKGTYSDTVTLTGDNLMWVALSILVAK